MKALELTKNLYWVGSLDPELRVFDIIMHTEYGTTYNGYVLKGSSKTALIETAKLKTYDQYLERLSDVVKIEDVDYIIVNHTEPDHAGSVVKLLELNPKITVVGTAKALEFLREIVNHDFNAKAVEDDSTLSLGDLTLKFMIVPNLHWPDTMYTYVQETGVLFTCDSFGAHYSDENVLLSKVTDLEGYHKALKYYYDMILGPFPTFMLKALDRIKDLNITMIGTGHGPVIDVRIPELLETYRNWATIVNPNTKPTVIMPYVSSYGYTEKIAQAIQEGILQAGDIDVRTYDLVTTPVAQVAGEVYFADGLLLGTPTILGDALKPLWDLTSLLFPVVHGGKLAAVFGSYGWSGEGVDNLSQRLTQLRMEVLDGLSVRFNPDTAKLQEARNFGFNFAKTLLERKAPKGRLKAWKCILCGEVILSENRPDICPVCGAPADQFIEIPYEEITYHNDTNERFVIVGGGAAAINAAEAIRARNTTAPIIVLSEEKQYAYNRPQLTKDMLADYRTPDFLLKERAWYFEKDIDLKLGVKATKIDPETKTVTLGDGSEINYDKLILAVGASNNILPIPGSTAENVVVIRNTKDVDTINGLVPMVKKVVVIGGGILGLEAAWQFKRMDLDVTVLEVAPLLMSRQLDEVTSVRLRSIVENKGVKVLTGVQIKEINVMNNWAKGVVLSDGSVIEGDLVVMSAGVKANTDLAKAMGLTVNRSIVVNDKMETSLEGVYACGDCAEYNGLNYAIWPQALEQGKVAGANAAGDSVTYDIVVPILSMHALDTEIFVYGDPGKDANRKYTILDLQDQASNKIGRYFFAEGGLVGGILLNSTELSITLMESVRKHLSQEKFLAKIL